MKVISGGQTGVDRAALDAARSAGLKTGGWCPLGGRAEDMETGLLEIYPELQETSSRDYRVRTKQNIASSDATLVVTDSKIFSAGTALTVSLAKEMKKPLLVTSTENIEEALFWLRATNPETLNVAGPRESNQPGIYEQSFAFLVDLFSGN